MKNSIEQKKNKFPSEAELVDELVSFLLNAGYKVQLEAPNMGQSVDVVASKKRWHMLIEAKLSNWRRALEQCNAHKLVGDHICIAIGTKGISQSLLDEVKKGGIGLIHCSPESRECTWIEPPRQNKSYWKPQREKFIQGLKDISYAD